VLPPLGSCVIGGLASFVKPPSLPGAPLDVELPLEPVAPSPLAPLLVAPLLVASAPDAAVTSEPAALAPLSVRALSWVPAPPIAPELPAFAPPALPSPLLVFVPAPSRLEPLLPPGSIDTAPVLGDPLQATAAKRAVQGVARSHDWRVMRFLHRHV
jgi:hypothetical protein